MRSVQSLVIVIFTLIFSPLGDAAISCSQAYSSLKATKATHIAFSQDFIGRYWAAIKTQDIVKEFDSWVTKKEGKSSKQDFLLEKTFDDPLPGMKDVDGQIRLIDNHHNFYAMTQFMGGKQRGFQVVVKLYADYTTINPKTGKKWTRDEMMEDLIIRHYILIYGKDLPEYGDLKSIPKDIHQLSDLPERSIMSLVFTQFSQPLKGSDFKPMIQLLLAEKMNDLNIPIVSEKPYETGNIHRVRDEILNSKDLLQFLLNQINPGASPKRVERVTEFLKQSLEVLETQNQSTAI